MPKLLKHRGRMYFAEVGEEIYLTQEDEDIVVCMNHAAMEILRQLNGFSTPQQISKAVKEACAEVSKNIGDVISEISQEFVKLGLVVEVETKGDYKNRYVSIEVPEYFLNEPKILKVWRGQELKGGMFVNSSDSDIHVIVPNVTDGPIKTCPANTCTIPAGLFTSQTIIRTFSEDWKKSWKDFRGSGITHMRKRY
ncbi:MAG: hypothetical protein ABOK23_06815 [Candidatus Methanoperedens sp.]|nr:hypothetical protein [Candidatus Methanoperedens sp.]